MDDVLGKGSGARLQTPGQEQEGCSSYGNHILTCWTRRALETYFMWRYRWTILRECYVRELCDPRLRAAIERPELPAFNYKAQIWLCISAVEHIGTLSYHLSPKRASFRFEIRVSSTFFVFSLSLSLSRSSSLNKSFSQLCLVEWTACQAFKPQRSKISGSG